MTISNSDDSKTSGNGDVAVDEDDSREVVRQELAALADPKRGPLTEQDVAVLREAGLEDLAEIAEQLV